MTRISIHALREEGDQAQREQAEASKQISIHALREEGDLSLILPSSSVVKQFLSTPSARRAT